VLSQYFHDHLGDPSVGILEDEVAAWKAILAAVVLSQMAMLWRGICQHAAIVRQIPAERLVEALGFLSVFGHLHGPDTVKAWKQILSSEMLLQLLDQSRVVDEMRKLQDLIKTMPAMDFTGIDDLVFRSPALPRGIEPFSPPTSHFQLDMTYRPSSSGVVFKGERSDFVVGGFSSDDHHF
jgi:hypothetical protein